MSQSAPTHMPLPWVSVMPAAPYFQLEDGTPWHPIGANEAITWPELKPLYRRRDLPSVEAWFSRLAASGVTCMRLMLEYAQVRSRYFETSVGKWSPPMVRLWDDIFALAERHNIRLLLTPFDTFWMWLRFQHHPYNQANGGPLFHPSQALLSRPTRDAIKARLAFAAERWGGSGALFAWDLWNEIHPAHAEGQAEPFHDFIADLSAHVRDVELRAHGRTHLQTTSIFGPELRLQAHLRMEPYIFRHPSLDFATIHVYETGTIDAPRNTVDAAVGMGNIVRDSLAEITDGRPFLDTEHGPIHTFKDFRKTLREEFDDEYFRHLQWAHLASGGAGGGMRWPNRHPHSLTPGMRQAQHALCTFLETANIAWHTFARANLTAAVELFSLASAADGKPSDAGIHGGAEAGETGEALLPHVLSRFACGTATQAILYLLRHDSLASNGQLKPHAAARHVLLALPGLSPGRYTLTAHAPITGRPYAQAAVEVGPGTRLRLPPLTTDMLLTLAQDTGAERPGPA